MYPLTQAELVEGFLAWDFDADTAATFFAQQVQVYSGALVDVWYSSCSVLRQVLEYLFAEQGSRIQQLVAAR